ncbi:hypothetical protein [Stenotrophomonas maltophilia]|uniref:hypothetical protein n=1 Tax=Stenotrophomonas maltophilia TaxID=40324 RepID=UPI003D7E8CA4
MKPTPWFWINVASHFGIVAALAWLPARWTGQLVEALAGTQPAIGETQHLALIGSVFGFCVTALILMGALTVTGELGPMRGDRNPRTKRRSSTGRCC